MPSRTDIRQHRRQSAAKAVALADKAARSATPPFPALRKLSAPFGFPSWLTRLLHDQRLFRPSRDRFPLGLGDQCHDAQRSGRSP